MCSPCAKVVISDVDKVMGEETANLAGENAIFMAHDVAEQDQWKKVIAQTVDHFGKLNVLVNNAGMYIPGNVETTTWEDYRTHQRIHMDGAFFGLKYGVETIKLNGEMGSIINIASTTTVQGYKDSLAYAACKGALRAMTRTAAIHCQQERYKIRVNCLLPGVIQTPLIERLNRQREEEGPDGPAPDLFEDQAPSPGIGEPMDVGNAVLFLASDESKFINGTELLIDNASVINPAPL